MAWLTATYLIASAPEQIEARAQALAIEQSVECPLEAIHDEWVRENVVARVASIEPAGDARFRVAVEIATATVGGETAQLFNMVFGNCSLWENVQLVDLELPADLLARFAGPRHGIAGIRELLGASHRPLTAAAMKPQGLSVDALARMCATFARAGVDVVKDDHGIADQAYSPFPERVAACQRAIGDVVAATGKPAFYAPHLIGTPRILRDHARIAREAGVRVVLVAPMLAGLPAFRDLVDEFPDFVYLAHPSFGGAARLAPPVLFGKIFRLLGADAPIFVNYGGRFAYPPEECAELAAMARAPWGGLRPALPVPAGGMRLDRVDELLAFYGPDTMLLIGGNLLLAEGEALLTRAHEFVAKVLVAV
ncbi:MAG TPA: RuBisCO large subunit C-terminal-like domain-containing protein [Candidatus Elarobacter sp.]|jgi:ribulose-bisphosphate carboxylase large chain|nr:RuBisCO large subunit C-terminal-like domain-containing protein [Candidatus Elarobacter sp.]